MSSTARTPTKRGSRLPGIDSKSTVALTHLVAASRSGTLSMFEACSSTAIVAATRARALAKARQRCCCSI